MICPYCYSTENYKAGHNEKGIQRFICKACERRYTTDTKKLLKPEPRTYKPCIQCGAETLNPRFCSRNCAAIYNNFKYPKRAKEGRIQKLCKYCGSPISKRRTVCDSCNPSYVDWSKETLGSLRKRMGRLNASSSVRDQARRAYDLSGGIQACWRCDYKHHIEICHIQAINSFQDETVITHINRLENLVALCPNCHWELDNGVLSIEEIFRREI